MKRFISSRSLQLTALSILAVTTTTAQAQTCRGAPRGGGIAFVSGKGYPGTTVGASLSKGVIGLGFNSLSETDGVSGWDANFRLTLPFGASRFQFCPSLGIDYKNEDVQLANDLNLTARIATAAAGIGFGYEQEVFKGVSLIPFAGVDYHFTAIVFTLDDETEDDALSGDTLSHFNIRYGALVQYKMIYAGISADRYSDTEGSRPYAARYVLGFAFGGGSSSGRRSPVPQRSQPR